MKPTVSVLRVPESLIWGAYLDMPDDQKRSLEKTVARELLEFGKAVLIKAGVEVYKDPSILESMKL